MDDRYNYPSSYPSGNDFIPDSGTMVNMDSLEATSSYSYAQPTQYNPYSYAPPVGSLGDGTGGSMGMGGVGGMSSGGVGMSSGVVDGNIGSTFYASEGLDDPFADEPPLLEELGINFDQIMQKTLAVLIPFKKTEQSILHESDLTGPLVFCFAFGMFLLLSGKLHFSYIYGIGIVGCLSVYFLLNLMSPGVSSISFICTVSVLGYSLLPMVVLSGLSVIFNLSTGIIGNAFAITAVLWCALSASKLFVTALALQRQQPLIAYPCALLYGVFALLTVF